MAAKKKGGKSGGDVIKLTEADYKKKTFKTAPGGTYFMRFTKKSTIKPGNDGNVLNVHGSISRGPHKGVTFFDNIAPHVGWKIAQLLAALGVKKMSLTLQALLKLVKEHGDEIRVQLREKKWSGKRQNAVVMYLPVKGKTDDEDEDQDDESDEENDEEEEDQDESEESDDEEEDSDDEDSDEDDEEESDDDESDDDDDEDSDDEEDSDDDDADEGDEDVEEDDDDADDDEEGDEDDEDADDEDEEEAPAKKRAVKKKAAPKTRRAPAKKKTATRRKK